MTGHQAPSPSPSPSPPPPPPPPHLHRQPLPRPSAPLYKQKSWSPDMYRDEAWQRRKGRHNNLPRRGNNQHLVRSKSVTDEDLDDLKACVELGFGFNSPDMDVDRRLSDTLPALELYYAVNKNYYDSVSKSASSSSSSLTLPSECENDSSSPTGSPHTIVSPGDDPKTVKTRLRHWAQVVACSVYLFCDLFLSGSSMDPSETIAADYFCHASC
ncbi:Protein of unknown function DUF1685 [Dillenia turbinata]|uniref:Uncharacterized protein n=1 Tax=Dillenia turbinata TaxID=194707 RepID=A0AAN8UVZ9_9MAGN